MIRQANINDIEIISSFNSKIALETEGLELNVARVKQGVSAILSDSTKGIYFLYEINQQVVGQLMVTYEWSDWRNGYFWWIQSVYVEKLYRRRGIFQELYSHVKKLVSSDSTICGLRLYVERENKTAQATYNKLGMGETKYLLYEWEK